jgi:hypothetical protein
VELDRRGHLVHKDFQDIQVGVLGAKVQ